MKRSGDDVERAGGGPLDGSTIEPPTVSALVIDDADVEFAIGAVESTGVVSEIEGWIAEKHEQLGYVAGNISVTALFVAFLLAASEETGFQFTELVRTLNRISDAMRDRLGLGPKPSDPAAFRVACRAVGELYWDVVAVIDPSSVEGNEDLLQLDREATKGLISPAGSVEPYQRLDHTTNAIVEASIAPMPEDIRRRWLGSVSLEMIAVPRLARVARQTSIDGSGDPHGGWVSRSAPGGEPEAGPFDRRSSPRRQKEWWSWSYRGTFAVAGPEGLEKHQLVPYMIVGMALHPFGTFLPITNARGVALRVLTGVRERGHPAGYVSAEGLFYQCLADDVQLLRSLGYQPVNTLLPTRPIGVPDGSTGVLELEGQSYCPVMWGIETLVAATVRFHRMMIDADEYRALLAWRESFAMRPEQAPGQYESLRVICPAEGEDRLMSCGEKPTSLDRGLPKMPSRPHQGLEVCTTESVTISGTSGAKVHWSSSGDSGEWHGCYATMRWIAETRFDQRIEAIRRPAKGIAAQSLYIAFIVFWENVRQLRRFIAEAETSSDGTTVDADEENLDY